jgi:DNA-binding XRE family transcriptional regulator
MIEYQNMSAGEFRALRQGMALTQAGLAGWLDLSRKTVVELEAGRAFIDARTAIALRHMAERTKMLENSFRVEESDRGTWIIVRRTRRQMPHATAMFYTQGDAMLYGEFDRRLDAYRWCAALRNADNPRNTRKLQRQRSAEQRERSPTLTS